MMIKFKQIFRAVHQNHIRKVHQKSSQNSGNAFGLPTILFTALTVNDASIIDYVQKNNFAIQQSLNNSKAAEVSLLNISKAPYEWTLVSDITTTKDTTKTLPTFIKSDSTQHSGNIQFDKMWSPGLLSTLKYSHLQSNASGGYGLNNWLLTLEKSVYPSLSNAAEKNTIQAATLNFESSQIEAELYRRAILRSQLDIYGKLQLMLVQIKENQILLEKYDKIVKTVQRKKQNNFAVAGELEQATAERKTREVNLKELEMNYKNTLEMFLNDNNFQNVTDVTISEPDFDLPSKIDKIVLSEKFPAEQHKIKSLKAIKSKNIRFEASEFDMKSTEDEAKPKISVFATYNAQGLDPQLAESFKQSQKSDTNKYSFGIKLVHEFDSGRMSELNAYKRSEYLLNQRIKENLEGRILQEIELARMDLKLALDQLASQTEILELRKQAVEQITQNYNQGRIDISLLFDAYNKTVQGNISRTDALNNLRLKKFDFETVLLTE
jgi:outer membrane protein TolC